MAEPSEFTAKHIALHPLEKALAWVVALHLVFLPWAKGTMHPWSQFVSGGFAVLEILLALAPRHYTPELSGRSSFNLYTWPKLLKFPVFWLGLGLLLYILLQALNPAWRYHEAPRFWYMLPIQHITWLPSGMDTPFEKTNAWRYLLIYGTAWLTVCAVWIGFTRRRPLQILLYVVVFNGVALAALGLLQKLTGATQMLWYFDPRANYFFATFIYKNHAAAYLNLVLAATIGLALWHYDRASRRMVKSDPSMVFIFLGLVLVVADVFTNSRLGMVLGVMLFAFGVARLLLLAWARRGTGANPAVMLSVTALFIAFAGFGAAQMDLDRLVKRFEALTSDRVRDQISTVGRLKVTEGTLEMFNDQRMFGRGAGSFRFYFPIYQQRHPEIYDVVIWKDSRTGKEGRQTLYWEYAHNDYVQFLAELGIVGSLFVAGLGLYGVFGATIGGLWRHPFGLAIVMGGAALAAHCWFDFQLHNPANLTTAAVLFILALAWHQHEQARMEERTLG